MFKWKIDVVDELKLYGYTTAKMRENLINPRNVTKINHNEMVTLDALDILCKTFDCQIEDLIVHVPDDEDPSIKHYKSRRKK